MSPKYYFYLNFNHPSMLEPLFAITPINYFDERGFLSDNFDAVSSEDLPTGFERVLDSYFSFSGSLNEGLELLRSSPLFKEKDLFLAINLKVHGDKNEIKKPQIGDIVQLNPETISNHAFCGCCMIVTEVKPWGVIGYVQDLGETKDTVGGRAYYRAKWEEIEPTGGRAIWVCK